MNNKMKTQTAVEWLISELTKNGFNFQNYQEEIERAKEREKHYSDVEVYQKDELKELLANEILNDTKNIQ